MYDFRPLEYLFYALIGLVGAMAVAIILLLIF